MKLSLLAPLVLAASLAAFAQQPMPRITSVDPVFGKAGDVIKASGQNLAKVHVAKLYLTDEKHDVPVELIEQTPTTLKFKIPAKAMTGSFALMVLTTGNAPKLIEEPVRLNVE